MIDVLSQERGAGGDSRYLAGFLLKTLGAFKLFGETASFEPLSGGSGWLGAGLLGLVLMWLLGKYIPDKDRQIERLIQLSTSEIANARQQFLSSEAESTKRFLECQRLARQDFKEENREDRKQTQDQFIQITTGLATIVTALHDGRELIVDRINLHTTESQQAGRHEMYNKIQEAVLAREVIKAKVKEKLKEETEHI